MAATTRKPQQQKKSRRSDRKAEPTAGPVIPSAYLLLALGLVVFAVSMPRFRDQVVRDNTRGAGNALLLVGEVAKGRGHRDVASLLAEEVTLRHRLPDARATSVADRLLMHGYYLDDALLAGGEAALAAWPIEHGRTGDDAWVIRLSDQALFQHPNEGRWTGEARPLRDVDLTQGWRRAR